MMQLLSALAHCHYQGVTHCGVKPENIMIKWCGDPVPSSPEVTLSDFRLATAIGEKPTDADGTRLYLPPEAFQDPYKVESKHDRWSAGLVFV